MTSEQCAWAAGLFEGEGTMLVQQMPLKYGDIGREVVRLRIRMTDRDVIEKFAGIVGCGKTSGPEMFPGRMNSKPQWRWDTAKEGDVRMLLTVFMPHLGKRRRARAEEVIQRLDNRRPALPKGPRPKLVPR